MGLLNIFLHEGVDGEFATCQAGYFFDEGEIKGVFRKFIYKKSEEEN